METNSQPAIKSYFFGKGYIDVINTIKGAFLRNWDSIKGYQEKLSDLSGEGFFYKLFFGIIYILSILVVGIFGTMVTGFISLLNIGVLVIIMVGIYISFSILWLADRIYLYKNQIFTACHECKEKSLIPTYICPSCGRKHTKLTPGVYGILKRRCLCGELLPTSFLNGRKDLEAECPHCHTRLTNREARPICIPIVGGRSVGKTAFITAFSKEFFDRVAKNPDLEIDFYNSEKEQIYGEILTDYEIGSTRMTKRSTDISQSSAVSFSFFLKSKTIQPDRLFHIYDIAGEVFTQNSENEIQKQYEYCHGIVFIIDPFSIPMVSYKHKELLEKEDIAGIGTADLNEIINSFLNKLREVTGLSDNKMAEVPIAVVISKIDSAGLYKQLGKQVVDICMKNNPGKFDNFMDCQDYLCRKFLEENEMSGFLKNVEIQFKNNKFFAASAIGHTRDKGTYNPVGVIEPMMWLIENADPKISERIKEENLPQSIS